jgi:hypothetical protein
VVLAVLGVALAVVADAPPGPSFVALFVLVVGFFAVSAVDAVREREAFVLGQAVWTALVFVILVFGRDRPAGVFLTAVAALAVAGAVVETYNHLAGTSYLRIEW